MARDNDPDQELAAAYRMELRSVRDAHQGRLSSACQRLASVREGRALAARKLASELADLAAANLDSGVDALVQAHFRAGDRDAQAIALRIHTQFIVDAIRTAPGLQLFRMAGVDVASSTRFAATHSAAWKGRLNQMWTSLCDRVLVERSKLMPGAASAPSPGGWPTQYALLEQIGTGGFAKVYSARNAAGDVVAVKLAADDEEARRRAVREREALHQLADHKNVICLLDAAEDASWLVFPRAEITLGGAALHGRIDGARLFRLVEQVGAGLAHAHALGLVHRDLAPENIMFLDGAWVLADWGLAKLPPQAAHSAMTKSGLGTAPWAAPEVLSDPANADGRADIFSLGRIVGWLVSGAIPEVNRPTRLPDNHDWCEFVRNATSELRGERPSNVATLLALMPNCAVHEI